MSRERRSREQVPGSWHLSARILALVCTAVGTCLYKCERNLKMRIVLIFLLLFQKKIYVGECKVKESWGKSPLPSPNTFLLMQDYLFLYFVSTNRLIFNLAHRNPQTVYSLLIKEVRGS